MYVSHRTDNIKQLAQFSHIELHYIPAELPTNSSPQTVSYLLPSNPRLDVCSRAGSRQTGQFASTKTEAVADMIEEWEELTEEVVRKG
jgi:hypothetical protein